MAPRQLRNACLTLNNYTEEQYNAVKTYIIDECKYGIIGKEVGESGTPHLQIYMQFNNRKSFNVVKNKFPTAHIESAKGSPEDNRTYCSKENNFIEIGTLQSPHTAAMESSAKYKDAISMARVGDFDKIQDTYPDLWLRYCSAFLKTHSLAKRNVEQLVELDNLWIYGPPGTGKSKYAFGLPNIYNKPLNKWWDGYNGETTVLLDDVDSNHTSWIGSFLKIWAHHYPFGAEIKGGSTTIRPKRIIVTSNYTIEELFGTNKQLCDAIKRRFK